MPRLPALVRALLNPSTYPHSPQAVQLVQTQMSLVFLTGEYVYKVKKPVDLGYLDYTTLEKRRFFCHQELRLNRRLAPDVYLGVVPIAQQNGRIILEASGDVVEYAVKMRQLPAERMMNVLLARDQVSEAMVRQVADKLAAFHQLAETNEDIGIFGSLNIVLTNAEENFFQIERQIGISISEEQYRSIRAYAAAFVERNADMFNSRVEQGRIRDCHGDLHSAHVCFANGISIYDCIEFNDRFRYCDVASEIAFLAMDLDYYGHGDLSDYFADAYSEAADDRDLLKLLNYYKCYRACVRGKVESFKLQDPLVPEEAKKEALAAARRYFSLAEAYALGRK